MFTLCHFINTYLYYLVDSNLKNLGCSLGIQDNISLHNYIKNALECLHLVNVDNTEFIRIHKYCSLIFLYNYSSIFQYPS